MEYIDIAIREPNLESSSTRGNSFLDDSPCIVSYLAGLGFKWSFNKPSYPDYYPKLPGALASGRHILDLAIFNTVTLRP